MAKREFPKEIFVVIEEDNDGGLWLNAEEGYEAHAKVNETVHVGRYVLKETSEVLAEPYERNIKKAR